MARITMTEGKFRGINACANEKGVIEAVAMDQRGSLRNAIARARGNGAAVRPEDLSAFKTAVARVLTKHASAILIDPEYGLDALQQRASGRGVLLAYEKTGYDASLKSRLPDLLDQWSARRLVEAGADVIKVLLYYNPFNEAGINTIKHAFIERVGAECLGLDHPFFVELVTYDDNIGGEKSFEFAKVKPKYVTAAIAEFTQPRYGIDVLKVEVPVNMQFVEGTRAYGGRKAYTQEEALGLFREAASAATKPFIYLSGGVSDEVFRETLELAAEAGTPYAGVLCGHATWQDGIPVYARQGYDALIGWLEARGVQNIEALNRVLARSAKPWWTVYGGKENIEVVGSGSMKGLLS